jgi:hypothetical protein
MKETVIVSLLFAGLFAAQPKAVAVRPEAVAEFKDYSASDHPSMAEKYVAAVKADERLQELELQVQAQARQIAELQAAVVELQKPKPQAAPKAQPVVYRQVQTYGTCSSGNCRRFGRR